MRKRTYRFLVALPLLLAAVPRVGAETRVVVSGKVLHPIDRRVFGVMMERADWSGEMGAEGAWDPARKTWRRNFVALWDKLGATVLRFPGGRNADYYDWRWGIDHVPGRAGGRPVTQRARTEADVKIMPPGTPAGEPTDSPSDTAIETHNVGTDEAAALCARTGAELSLTVNAFWFQDDPAKGAALASDWVEYCNSPDDGSNPNGGVAWAHVRALNGHKKPYNVRLWEIGNEVWLLHSFPAEKYGKLVAVYADAMRKVDPNIEIQADTQRTEYRDAVAKYAGKRVQYIVFHHYEPMGVDLAGLTADQVWNAAAAMPTGSWDNWVDRVAGYLKESGFGYRAALTEWNIHGWDGKFAENGRSWDPNLPKYVPFGLSMAAWLDDILRHSDVIPIADASMITGREWANTLIRYTTEGDHPAYPFISYHVFRLYAHGTGKDLLDSSVTGAPTFDNPVRLGAARPATGIPMIEATASRDKGTLYLHLVNRSRDAALPVDVDLSALPVKVGSTPTRRWLDMPGILSEPSVENPNAVTERQAPLKLAGKTLRLTLPARSVSVVAVALTP